MDSALTVGFCLMKRREADSAVVMYLGVRIEIVLLLVELGDMIVS